MSQTSYDSHYPDETDGTHDLPELSLHPSRPAAQKLATAGAMVTCILRLLAELDLNVDPHTKILTRLRSAAKTSLIDLSYHIQSLMGDDTLH